MQVRGGRKTIGVLMGYLALFTGTYDAQIRNAFQEKCRELDLNLLTVYAGALGDPRLWSVDENSVFDLMHPDCVDGLILISSCLASLFGLESVHHLAHLHRSLPLCSIGIAIPGVPSVVIDNRGGMEAVLEHLIAEHGCRRPAFIAGAAGNPEADVRFDAYVEVLRRHELAFDPALVVDGNFTNRDGQAAMEQLLSRGVGIRRSCSRQRQHGIRRDGRAPQARPARAARAACHRLRRRADGAPRQPTADHGRSAVRDDGRRGDPHRAPATRRAPGGRVCRASGAIPRSPVLRLRRANETGQVQGSNQRRVSASEYLRTHAGSLARALTAPLGVSCAGRTAHREPLAGGAFASACRKPRPVLVHRRAALESTDDDPASCRALECAIARLRDELRCCAEPELEDLWHDARDLIAHRSQRGQVQERIELDNDYLRIVDLNRHLTRAVDLPSLKQALLRMMPSLGISNASFSRYAEGSNVELEPWVCMLNGRPFDPPPVRFAARQLVPAGIWATTDAARAWSSRCCAKVNVGAWRSSSTRAAPVASKCCKIK